MVHRGFGSSVGGLPACVLGCVGGAGSVCPLLADGRVCVRHGHTEEHLAVLQFIRPLQGHIHAAHHCGYVSTKKQQVFLLSHHSVTAYSFGLM